jgi:pantoate--beta-alanine ligase
VRAIRTVAELRPVIFEQRRAGRSVGLVPTMGAFHAGHLSLMRRARAECDVVVVSLFVNPTQFNEASDLDAYPRDEARDAALAEELGVDVLFAPPVEDVYPPGFATTVSVDGLTETLEGRFRGRQHFDGVTTVVTKLFNMVVPDVAYFGQKDAQQAVVVARIVRDLDMPVRIELCETVREPDGLAMSSRNVHLSADDRARATALSRALDAIDAALADGVLDTELLRARAAEELRAADIEPDYLELVSAETLAPVPHVDGEVLALVAARVGTTRLIDNHRLMPARVTAGATDQGGHECNERC